MPANVESLFYVSNERERFVPWHGLGTAVAEAPTSADALRLAGLDWDVVQKPVSADGIEIPGYYANVRSSDNRALGIVSNRYKIVQNKDAFAFTDALLGEGVTYETAGSLKNGKTIWLLGKMEGSHILGDAVEPYLCFTNSHDGSGAVNVCMTPVRVVCNNTLNLALNTASRRWSTRHIGDISSKMEEAKNTLAMANNYMKYLDEEADKLANQKITDSEIEAILEEIFPIDDEHDTDRKKTNMLEARNQIMICYMSPDIQKFLGTKYGFVNAVADWCDHAAPARMTKNYAENNWGRVMYGHPILDAVYDKLCVNA